MAEIPTFQQLSKVQPQPDTAVATVRPSPVGNATAGLGETIAQEGAQMQDANDQYELASAKAKFLQSQIQTEDSLKHDQDFSTHASRYTDALGKTQQDLAQTISNPRARAAFQSDTGLDMVRGLSSVKDNAFKVGAGYRVADTENQITSTMQAAAAKRDPAVLSSAIGAVNGMLQANVKAGITTPEQAQAQSQKLKTDYASQAVKDLPYEQQVKALAPHVVTPDGASTANASGAATVPQLEVLTNIVKQHESGGRETNPDGSTVTSPKGAKGIMQVMDVTATDPGYGVAPAKDNSPEERARVGEDYLHAMVDKYGMAKGLAAYNAGPGAVDKAVAAADAAGNPDGWLQKLPAETQAYVAGISNDYQKTAGGVGAAPAKLEADPKDPLQPLLGFLSPAEKQQQYETAAQNAIYQKMENDPQAALALTKQPEYQGLGAEKLTALRQAARDRFEKLREIGTQDNIIAQAATHQDLWNDFSSGKLTLSNFGEAQQAAQDAGHPIDQQLSNYMVRAMASTAPKQTPDAQAAAYNDLSNRNAAFAISTAGGKVKGKGDLQQYVEFQKDVIKSMNDGLISEKEADGFLRQTAPVLNKQVQNPKDLNEPGFITGLWKPDTPYVKGYKAINDWATAHATGDAVQDSVAKAEILRRFVLASENADYDSGKSDPGVVARNAIDSYSKSKYPVLQMLDSMPNAILLGAGQKAEVSPQSTAKPTTKVTVDFDIMRDKYGGYAKVFKDGTVEELGAAESAKYKAQGQ